MEALSAEVLRSLSEADLREHFDRWMAEERTKGLTDIKFALNNDGCSTVTDVMRQLLILKTMKANGELSRYVD